MMDVHHQGASGIDASGMMYRKDTYTYDVPNSLIHVIYHT